jgi:ABC-type branched-subunit amino acid transport system ATPase component
MLELRNISAGYGTGRVLENVNLVVPDGAVVALLGPNGAGKTTLLKVMSGLLRPMSGRVLLDGDDVTGASPFELARSGICHVPEGRGIFPTLSVADNLRLQAPRSVDRRAVELAAAVFPRLAQRRNQLAGTCGASRPRGPLCWWSSNTWRARSSWPTTSTSSTGDESASPASPRRSGTRQCSSRTSGP